jgi:hypothetical protein
VGRGVDNPPASSAGIKKRATLGIHFSSGLPWPVIGSNLPYIHRLISLTRVRAGHQRKRGQTDDRTKCFILYRKRLDRLRTYTSAYTTGKDSSLPAVKKPQPEPGYSPNLVTLIKRQTMPVLVHEPSWRIQRQT